MTDINLKTLTPDTSLPTTGYLFGADSQSVSTPSVYSTQTVATTLLGSTSLTGTDPITTSAPLLNLTQAWNNSGTTFTGLRFNVDTNTYNQSAAASLLMDLQVGGTSKFSVKKDGSVSTGAWQGTAVGVAYGGTGQTTASAGFNALSPVTSTGDLIVGNGTNSSTRLGIGSTGQVLTVSGGTATWAAAASGSGTVTSVSVTTANGVSGTVATATTTPAISLSLGAITPTSVALNSEAFLTSDAANIVAQRNGVNAQTFNVYNTYTDTSNYERGFARFSSNRFDIGTEKLGSGTARELRLLGGQAIRITPASGFAVYLGDASQIAVNTGGNIIFLNDNSNDVGLVNSLRPRSVYAGTSITPGAGVLVANLPTPSTGMVARVTNALAPAIGTAVAGGGAAQALVWYNGANWTVIGV